MDDAQISQLLFDLDVNGDEVLTENEWVSGYDKFLNLNNCSRNTRFAHLIAPGGGCTIPDTALRAIGIDQLERIYEHVTQHFGSWTVSRVSTLQDDLTRGSLRVSSDNFKRVKLKKAIVVNLYDICENLILPATFRALNGEHCSMVELMATSHQPPDYFCSHWWGQPCIDFLHVLQQHSKDRNLPAVLSWPARYWICAYANSQRALGSDMGGVDLEKSSFYRAMRISRGTISVVDKNGICFSRIWCVYELWESLLYK